MEQKITKEEYEYAMHQICLYQETVKRYQRQALEESKAMENAFFAELHRSHPELNP